ncbi:MAG: hypothetical protein BWK78_02810 [Thiotrichaceae bacterium IS1]|nr:MAG: hypothetical protein BWK78_02810 [Thiotrichaceae bacterium IS1]
MRKHTDEQFTEAEFHWNLIRLYKDLAAVKGEPLTPVEKLRLRGLLCGYSPAEMADKLHKNIKGMEVDLSKTIYRYVKVLVNKSSDKVINWRNIQVWLEQSGYKIPSSLPSQLQVNARVNYHVENNVWVNSHVDAQIKVTKASYNRGNITLEFGVRVVVPLPKLSLTDGEEDK